MKYLAKHNSVVDSAYLTCALETFYDGRDINFAPGVKCKHMGLSVFLFSKFNARGCLTRRNTGVLHRLTVVHSALNMIFTRHGKKNWVEPIILVYL